MLWILFFIIITVPGHYEVHPLQTYPGATAEADCKAKQKEITTNFKSVYKFDTEQDTYLAFCLKQPTDVFEQPQDKERLY